MNPFKNDMAILQILSFAVWLPKQWFLSGPKIQITLSTGERYDLIKHIAK